MQAAILAGGLATRLGELTKHQPKSMLPIMGKSFLEYQLDLLAKEGIVNIVLCIGHLGAQIVETFGTGKKFGVNIKYSYEAVPLGTAGALRNAESLLEDPFISLYGDSFVSMDFSGFASYFSSHDKLAMMSVYKNYDKYDRSNTEIKGNLVTRYSKNVRTSSTIYIDYGVNIFRKDVLKLIPRDHFYSLEDLFIRLIERQQLLAYKVKDRFFEIGSFQGLREFEQYVAEAVK